MTPNVRSVIDRVLVREGGIADVGDGKGLTRFGQTPGWLADWGLTAPETADAARENYAAWMVKTGLDGVCDADVTLGAAVTDWAVNSGHQTAIKALQRSFGIAADGVIGPTTRHWLTMMTPAAARRITLFVHCARLEFVGRIITDEPEKHARYAAGWCNRLAKNLRADLG